LPNVRLGLGFLYWDFFCPVAVAPAVQNDSMGEIALALIRFSTVKERQWSAASVLLK
jgi:hypothetical protein